MQILFLPGHLHLFGVDIPCDMCSVPAILLENT
jgi:hypothetical protein